MGAPKPGTPRVREVPVPDGERPIDRFLTWGDGLWGMVFGNPDMFLGRPMFLEPVPPRWELILQGSTPIGESWDTAEVKAFRKQQKGKK